MRDYLGEYFELHPELSDADEIKNKLLIVFSDGDYDEIEKVKLLIKFDGSGSRNKFYDIKKILKDLFDYLLSQGLVTQSTRDYVYNIRIADIDTENNARRYFFADLNEAIDFVNFVARSYGAQDDDAFLLIKTFVILCWYNLDKSEQLNIMKSDICESDCSVRSDGRRVHIDPKHFDIISAFSKAKEFNAISKNVHRVLRYCDSEYLFRSARSDKLSPAALTQHLVRFNDMADAVSGHELSTSTLITNGHFTRLREDGVKEISAYSMQKILGHSDIGTSVLYCNLYKKWLEIYHLKGDEE